MRHTNRAMRRMRVALATVAALAGSLAAGSTVGAETGCPTWTKGGSLIYCASVDAGVELFERSSTGDVRRLTYLGGRAGSPSLSPDGARIAFDVTYDSPLGTQVFVVDRFGPRSRVVLVGSTVIEIPPQGPSAVMVGGTLVPIPPAQVRRLTDIGQNRHPAFTPEGDRIDFTSDRLGVPALWSMDIDGSDQRQMLLATSE